MAGKLKDAPEEVQGDLWPELDTTKPAQKALLALARKYARESGKRKILLDDNKAFVDGLMDKLVAAMEECDIKKFRHEGVKVEIQQGKMKALVKLDDGDEEENAGSDE